MRGHGLAGPYGAGLIGGVVADCENEIEFGRARLRELEPALGTQAAHIEVELAQEI